jgi:hypothetical protein
MTQRHIPTQPLETPLKEHSTMSQFTKVVDMKL